jgi:hypothetical protein
MADSISHLVPTQFQELIFLPITYPKIPTQSSSLFLGNLSTSMWNLHTLTPQMNVLQKFNDDSAIFSYITRTYSSFHGLIKYIEQSKNKKCRHLKEMTCEGTLRQVFIRVHRLEISSVMLVFSTQLCELMSLDLLSSSTLPPSPLPWVNKYTVYTYKVCKGGRGVWGSGPQTDKHLPQCSFTGQFFPFIFYFPFRLLFFDFVLLFSFKYNSLVYSEN